jgi:glycosyltransferase involved in cell wall biosynthesis
MANLSNIKSGWRQFLAGYLSVGDVLNMAINQILYKLTEAYFWSVSILRGRPGVMRVKSKFQKSGKEKKVLISFVLRPLFKTHLIGRIRYYFSINGLTIYLIRAFNELGYTCDVIHCIDNNFKVKDSYEVAVCDATNFKTLHYQLPKDCVRIAFQTGAYWRVHNAKEEQRFMELKQRRGADLNRDRWAANGELVDFMLKNANAILALGDSFTRESFQSFPNLHPYESAFLDDLSFSEKNILSKNFGEAKNNFIYFGGGGEVHKGQDLLLEVFSKQPHLQLFLCSNFSPAFLKVYELLLKQSPNIHLVGYLPQRSRGFYKLIDQCGFNLHLSCSEGSPGGVIELLQYGIIPVATHESNINVSEFGFQLESHGLEEITQVVLKLSQMPEAEVKKHALQTRQAGLEKFSTAVFLSNLKHILKDNIKIP